MTAAGNWLRESSCKYCSFSSILFYSIKLTYNFLFQCNWLAIIFLTLAIMLRFLTLVIMLMFMTLVLFCHHKLHVGARGGAVG